MVHSLADCDEDLNCNIIEFSRLERSQQSTGLNSITTQLQDATSSQEMQTGSLWCVIEESWILQQIYLEVTPHLRITCDVQQQRHNQGNVAVNLALIFEDDRILQWNYIYQFYEKPHCMASFLTLTKLRSLLRNRQMPLKQNKVLRPLAVWELPAPWFQAILKCHVFPAPAFVFTFYTIQ